VTERRLKGVIVVGPDEFLTQMSVEVSGQVLLFRVVDQGLLLVGSPPEIE
jgi:hypothetical protein